MMQAATALFVGDVCHDMTFIVDHVPVPDEKVHVLSSFEAVGGVVANAAVACARAGGSVRMLLRTGTDGSAGFVLRGLAENGVGVESGAVEGRTAQVVILLEPHGEKRLLLDPGVSMYPSDGQVDAVDLSGVAFVHTAAYGPAARRLADRCRAARIPWSLDLEPASFGDGIDELSAVISGAATVFCNQRAASRIGEAPADRLLAMGAEAVILTVGANGVVLQDRSGERHAVQSPVPPVVRDTTGAGDCLAGWFVAERLKQRTALEALRSAVAAAARSCEHPGAQAAYPTPAELQAFLERARGARVDTEGGGLS